MIRGDLLDRGLGDLLRGQILDDRLRITVDIVLDVGAGYVRCMHRGQDSEEREPDSVLFREHDTPV
jgi:hypothetical protein